MARLTKRFKVVFTHLIVGALCISLGVEANDYGLASQGLSQNIKAYSSVDFQNNKQPRQLRYSPLKSETVALELREENGKFKLLKGQKVFQPLFESIQKKGDLTALKQGFVDHDDVEKEAELNENLIKHNDKVARLTSELNNEPDLKKKQSIEKDLSDLAQQQRNVKKAIQAVKRRQARRVSLKVYDISEVFAQSRKKDFFLVDDNAMYLVKPQTSRISYDDRLSGRTLSVTQITYKLVSKVAFNLPGVFKKMDSQVLKAAYYQETMMRFSYHNQTAVLSHLQDAGLLQFAQLLQTTPLEPKRLSFKGETLKTQYMWSNSGKQKTLEVAYKETGKRKNLIQVKASAQSNVFDPKQSSTALEKHIGVLAVAKGERLVELKKIQTINGKKDIGWDQDIRNGIIKLADETIFVSKEDYYGYEGLWYLASWMSTNNIQMKKIFLINGTEPISLTAKLVRVGELVISKAGNVLYQFSVDSNGFVTRLYFAPAKQTLVLISKDTKTTQSNKAKVKQYMKANKIVLL